ncbi:unnamed protein product, partial [Closterium sp. NIES-54]
MEAAPAHSFPPLPASSCRCPWQVEERIKEGPKNALDPHLAAIAWLHEGVAYFEANRSFKSAEAALAHSKALLLRAWRGVLGAFSSAVR